MRNKRILAFLFVFVMLTGLCSCSASAKGLIPTKKEIELRQKGNAFWAEQKVKQVGETMTETDYVHPLSYALQYPETGHPQIDARIASIVTDIRNSFDQEFTPQPAPRGEKKRDLKPEATLYLGYETYLANEDLMTLLFFSTTENAEGLSPHTRMQAFHFSLTEDKEIPADELMWTDFKKNASAYTQNYFTSTEPYSLRMFGDYATRLDPENGYFDRFTFTEEGVLFHFDRYSLFPGSMGIVTLTIPYEDMKTRQVPPAEDPAVTMPDKNKKIVALTFDDGPNPVQTNRILDALEKYDARATFFDLGSLAERYPQVVQREAALGCEVASHSYDHQNFSKMTPDAIKADVAKTDAAFQKAIGKSPAAFRPPYGSFNDSSKSLIPAPIYLWSVDTLDWKSRNADAVLKEVKKVGNLDGKVILMHGIYGSSAEAVEKLVPYLQKQGYELVTVSELIYMKHGQAPQNSKLYGYSYFK